MKRSIVYAGMFSVMVSVSATTDQVLAAAWNLSDAVTTSIIQPITWVEMPEVAPDVSAAVVVPPSDTQPTIDGTAPERAPDNIRQDSERMRSDAEQTPQAPDKSADDMDMKSERMRKVGAPRF